MPEDPTQRLEGREHLAGEVSLESYPDVAARMGRGPGEL